MRDIYVLNPVAGKNFDVQKLSEEISNCYAGSDIPVEIYVTQVPYDATRFVKERCAQDDEPKRFFACGGDGTANEVVNGMIGFPNVAVGVVPCGSGNDFVKNFETDGSFRTILHQMQGETTKVDLLKVNGRYVVNLCNMGFDADVAHNMIKFKKLPLVSGSLAYTMSVFYCLLSSVKTHFHIETDGQTFDDQFLLAVAANGICYGGHYKAAPLAKTNDGDIDCCFVKAISRLKFVKFLKFYEQGKHLEVPELQQYIHYLKCHQMTISSEKSFTICIDGETFRSNQVEISIEPAAFDLVIPRAKAPAVIA